MRPMHVICVALAAFAAIPLDSQSGSLAPETPIAIADPCDGTTPAQMKVLMPEAKLLLNSGPPITCIVKGTVTTLSAVSVRAIENRYGTGSVEVRFTAPSKLDWSVIAAAHVGKPIILLRRESALLQFQIRDSVADPAVLSVPSMSEAETIAKILRGEGDDAL